MREKTFHDQIVDVLQTDLADKSAVIRWAVLRVKLSYDIGEKFIKDDCLTYAASLAYTTLLALAPLAAIGLSILPSFGVSPETVLQFLFERLLPNQDLAGVIEQNVDTFASNAASVGRYGIFFLAVFAWWVLSTIEASFNMIWKVGRSRPVVSQFVTYWFAVTFAPFLIALSIVATAKLQAIVQGPDWAQYTYVQGMTLKLLPYALTWIAFFLVYKLIPFTNVYFKPALIGAVIAGTMFELAKLGFNYYLTTFATYKAVYGALAVIPIFLFWLYLTWLIVLLGAVISYAIQYPKEIIKSKDHEEFDRSAYTTYYAIRILIEATRSFEVGAGALDPKEVQKKLEITGELYDDITGKLKSLDLIEMVEGAEHVFLLKQPPETLSVTDILLRFNGSILDPAPEPEDQDRETIDRLYTSIIGAVEKGADHLTLLSLAIPPTSPAPPSAEGEEQRAESTATFKSEAESEKEGRAAG